MGVVLFLFALHFYALDRGRQFHELFWISRMRRDSLIDSNLEYRYWYRYILGLHTSVLPTGH